MEKQAWTRQDTVKLVLEIEKKRRLDEVVVNGIKIWPWVRIKLFFFLINNLERADNKVKPFKKNNGLKNKLKSINIVISHLLRYSKLKNKKYIFIGSKNHRVPFDGKFINRFTDPLIINSNLQRESIEIDIDINFEIKSNKFFYLPILKKIFSLNKRSDTISIEERESILQIVKSIKEIIRNHSLGIEVSLLNGFENRLITAWVNTKREAFIWELIFKRINPKAVFTLCYYTDSVFAANLAASKLNLPKIEFQHGPINHLHLAYGSFENAPACHDSQFLPDIFLTWDAHSKIVLDESLSKKQAINFGHPWFDYCEQQSTQLIEGGKKIITYALQPSKEMGEPLPEYLVKWIIQSKDEYDWWFRLHPRQLGEYNEIRRSLEGLLVDVNWEIDHPSIAPLPVILSKSSYVITYCSGVISEAAFVGVPSIALSEIANDYYKQELELRMLYIVMEEDKAINWKDLLKKMQSVIQVNILERENSFISFDKLVEKLNHV